MRRSKPHIDQNGASAPALETQTREKSRSAARGRGSARGSGTSPQPETAVARAHTSHQRDVELHAKLAESVSEPPTCLDFDVVIAGYGPVGALACLLMLRYGVRRVCVVERDTALYAAPRAVAMDDEVVRAMALVDPDLCATVDAMTSKCAVDIRNAPPPMPDDANDGDNDSKLPMRLPWLCPCLRTSVSVVGPVHTRTRAHTALHDTVFFHQPRLERLLRERATPYAAARADSHSSVPGLTRLFGWEVCGIEHVHTHTRTHADGDGHQVRVTARRCNAASPSSPSIVLRSRVCIAADGGASSVRRLLGIAFKGETFPDQPWLVVDTEDVGRHLPRKPDVAARVMRDASVLAERWQHFNFICDPARPFVHVPLPGPEGGRRFEFMLHPNEDPIAMTKPAAYEPMLRAIGVKPEAVHVVRVVVYTFHARQAERWRDRNVVFMGDAAHCMPPFRGQGMCAGLRDAATAGWRVASVVHGALPADGVLASYETERRTHVVEMTGHAVRMGFLITFRWQLAAALRNVVVFSAFHNPLTGPFIKEPFTAGSQLHAGLFDFHTAGGYRLGETQQRRVPGWLLRDEATGCMFPNLSVAHFDAAATSMRTVTLDAAWNASLRGTSVQRRPCWLVLFHSRFACAAKHPLQSLSAAVQCKLNLLRERGDCLLVQLIPSCGSASRAMRLYKIGEDIRRLESWMELVDHAWADETRKCSEWLEAADAAIAIVRPDTFVYGAYAVSECHVALMTFVELFGKDALPERWLRYRASVWRRALTRAADAWRFITVFVFVVLAWHWRCT